MTDREVLEVVVASGEEWISAREAASTLLSITVEEAIMSGESVKAANIMRRHFGAGLLERFYAERGYCIYRATETGRAQAAIAA